MAISNYLTLSHLRKALAALDPRFKKIESDISKTATKEYVDTATSEAVAEEAAAIETEISGLDGRVTALESVTVDAELSGTSTNPVQNKVIYSAMQGKADASSLADTNISNPADGQVLQYDATSSKWVNTTFSTGVTETRVNELIVSALAQYGDGDTATYGGA